MTRITNAIVQVTCDHLKLKVPEEYVTCIREHFNYIKNSDNTPEEQDEYIHKMLVDFILYKPWCAKLKQACITTESVAIADGCATLDIIYDHTRRIFECGDDKLGPPETLGEFVLKRIDLDNLSP